MIYTHQDVEVAHWKKFASIFDKISGWSTPAGQHRVKKRVEMILNFCNFDKNKKALELGCGTGIFTKYLAEIFKEIIAIDISEDMIEIAKQRIKNDNVKFQIVDIHNLPFNNESFDIVVGISVLHHLNVYVALNEIYRVLKFDGILLLSEPNMLNPQVFIQKNIPLIKKLMKDTLSETAFFKWQIYNILRNKLFRDIRVIPFDFLHPLTPQFFVTPILKISQGLEKIPVIREFAGSLFIVAKK